MFGTGLYLNPFEKTSVIFLDRYYCNYTVDGKPRWSLTFNLQFLLLFYHCKARVPCINQSINQSNNQSIDRSIEEKAPNRSINQSIHNLLFTFIHSANQAINQSINYHSKISLLPELPKSHNSDSILFPDKFDSRKSVDRIETSKMKIGHKLARVNHYSCFLQIISMKFRRKKWRPKKNFFCKNFHTWMSSSVSAAVTKTSVLMDSALSRSGKSV